MKITLYIRFNETGKNVDFNFSEFVLYVFRNLKSCSQKLFWKLDYVMQSYFWLCTYVI